MAGGMVITDRCDKLADVPPLTADCPVVGDNVSITCSLDPTGGGGQLSLITPNGSIISGGSLSLDNIQPNDAGLYTCKAENDADVCTPAEFPFEILVDGE